MDMKKNSKKIISVILLVASACFGIIGYMQINNGDFYWALLSTIKLFKFNMDFTQFNLYVEIARWLAPVITVTLLFSFFSSISEAVKYSLRARREKACAIYGNSSYTDELGNQLGNQAIRTNKKISFLAKKQVLLFNNDAEALDFFTAHQKHFNETKEIYINLNSMVRDSISQKNVHVINMADNCARVFWNRNRILNPEKVVLIGFSEYGQKIFNHGVLNNVFSIDQNVTYHVFGNSSEYRALHHELKSIMSINHEVAGKDSVYFHEDDWYEQTALLETADKIILCDEPAANIDILGKIAALTTVKAVHIRVDSIKMLDILFKGSSTSVNILPFGTTAELCTPNIIMDENLDEMGKKAHAVYFKNNSCKKREAKGCLNHPLEECTCCREFEKDWSQLSSFLRNSNIAQADHIPVKLCLMGLSEKINFLSKEEFDEIFHTMPFERREELAEIEHIRWSRYLYINNWKYSETRSNADKLHPCLLPYTELSDALKAIDLESYKNLYEIIK